MKFFKKFVIYFANIAFESFKTDVIDLEKKLSVMDRDINSINKILDKFNKFILPLIW